ncbi:MAG: GTPase ObgE [Candidatus Paceibacterota bacterium]|jgi:GTP-binding protein
MAFIDEIKFYAQAGRGGDGVVRWRHEKGREFAGASGGNGGKGGDVFVHAVRDINLLSRHKTVKIFKAMNGESGMNSSMHGKNGEDLCIDLPIGSIVTNKKTARTIELMQEGQIEKILHGGRGGVGNEHFKASTNVRPEQSTPGTEGEEADFEVELNLIADVGLIGLPNAGKSSLLNALTNAHAKVANYAFTTLDPNLGALPGGYVVADIPGLIEGASKGKGLGVKFLRHVKRTKMLMHLISLENDIEAVDNFYRVIRHELDAYGYGLGEKVETIVLTKTDLASDEEIERVMKTLQKYNKDILKVTILDDNMVKKLAEEIVKRIK